MKNRNSNIAILAFFQLLFFVASITLKAGHHHESDPVSSSHLFSGKTLSREVRCPVCNFEFVTFNIHRLSVYFCFQYACTIDFTASVEKVFKPLFTYFSLRAPPQF